jgi:26S proteasome regulatory subunit N11
LQSFEQLNPRAVAVVVDPIQSVKGKVVIDAFRLINPQSLILGQEPRQVTSNIGHLSKPSIQALIHGLNRHYYSIAINYRKNDLEQKVLFYFLGLHVIFSGLLKSFTPFDELIFPLSPSSFTPQMLMNLNKKSWDKGLKLQDFKEHETRNEKAVSEMLALAKLYNKVLLSLGHSSKSYIFSVFLFL